MALIGYMVGKDAAKVFLAWVDFWLLSSEIRTFLVPGLQKQEASVIKHNDSA